jgi:predicted site-specific integrase-resolvase
MGVSLSKLPLLCRTRDWVRILGINQGTFYHWVRSGVIPPPITRPGSLKLWPRETLVAFVEGRRANAE